MELAIVGLQGSGKTTVFNALTQGHARAGSGESGKPEAHVGVAKVPDPRLERLAHIFQPQRVVPAEVRYVDVPGAPPELGKSEGIAGRYLNILERADALLLVVRAFSDPSVPHPLGTVDPHRDFQTMQEELAFADLGILERRVQRLETELKGARPDQRERVNREKTLLERVKQALEDGTPVRRQDFSDEDERSLRSFQLLTAKPLLTVWNIGEEALEGAAALEEELNTRHGAPDCRLIALCGKLEMELGQMDPAEEREFRESLGLGESGRERVLRLSHEVLGLVTFFTTASGEVRAWTVPRGTPAAQAAGRIHSDMERGFIRAEVAHFTDIDRMGSVAELRKAGVLRREGKAYQVQDGDVITFLFNV